MALIKCKLAKDSFFKLPPVTEKKEKIYFLFFHHYQVPCWLHYPKEIIVHLPIELAGANSPAPLIMALLEVKDELFLMEDPDADPPPPPDPGAKLKLVLDMDCGDDEGVIISLYSNL